MDEATNGARGADRPAGGGPGSDLKIRVLAGLVMTGVALGALWLGGWTFWALTTLASLFAFREWAGLLRARGFDVAAGLFSLALIALVASGLTEVTFTHVLIMLGLGGLVTAVAGRSAMLGVGVLYIGLALVSLLALREWVPYGLLLATWALGCIWATDIGAYFAGRLIGGPRLAPAISPNKTWAGLAGGVIAAALCAGALALWKGLPWPLVAVSPVLAVIAQAGDLLESAMKRRAGVKDSGTLLPGHGGALDRLDGVIAAAPFALLALAGLAA